MDISYLAGYFLADGYSHKNPDSKARLYSETKDLDFADALIDEFGGSVTHRVRVVRTGVSCDIYTISFSKESSLQVRKLMKSYKNFEEGFYNLSLKDQDRFVYGYFDGDGSVCRYSNSNRSRIILYSSDVSITRLLENYLNSRGIRYSKGIDSRRYPVEYLNVGNKQSVIKLWMLWREKIYLNRKALLLKETLNLIPWYSFKVEDKLMLSCDRKVVEKLTGYSQSSISQTSSCSNKCDLKKYNSFPEDLINTEIIWTLSS